MIGKLRQWTMTPVNYFGVAAVVVLGNSGYLPKVGPPPLRLAPVFHADTNAPIKIDMPQPKPENVESPKTDPQPTPVKTQNTDTNVALVPLVVTATPAPATNPPAPASVTPAAPDQIISPQMFLQYFNATPAKGGGTPIEFTPPQGSASAPSPNNPPTTKP